MMMEPEPGTAVWVEDVADVWVAAEVVASTAEAVTIKVASTGEARAVPRRDADDTRLPRRNQFAPGSEGDARYARAPPTHGYGITALAAPWMAQSTSPSAPHPPGSRGRR